MSWACGACTFHNPAHSAQCSICEMPRGIVAAAASVDDVRDVTDVDLVACVCCTFKHSKTCKQCPVCDFTAVPISTATLRPVQLHSPIVMVDHKASRNNVSNSFASPLGSQRLDSPKAISLPRNLVPLPTKFPGSFSYDDGPRLVRCVELVRASMVVNHFSLFNDTKLTPSQQSALCIVKSHLCTIEVDHIASLAGIDRGWGCGYRNIMMLCSAARRVPLLAHTLLASELRSSQAIPRDSHIVMQSNDPIALGSSAVPSISAIQQSIEFGWSSGFDEISARQFNRSLQANTGRWIGSAECATIFRVFGINATVFPFRIVPSSQPQALLSPTTITASHAMFVNQAAKQNPFNVGTVTKQHTDLMDFVWNHFAGAETFVPDQSLCSNCSRRVQQNKPATVFQPMFDDVERLAWLNQVSATQKATSTTVSAFQVSKSKVAADKTQTKLTSFVTTVQDAAPAATRTGDDKRCAIPVDCDDIDFNSAKRPKLNSTTRCCIACRPSSDQTRNIVLPLFLQHHGHSRTIIGVEERANGSKVLLVLDPIHNSADLYKQLCRGVLPRVSLSDLGKRDYEIVRIDGRALMSDAQRAKSRVIAAGEIVV